jgi:hypothetical protein
MFNCKSKYRNHIQVSERRHLHHKASSPFFKGAIQHKLTINQPGDIYEKEADAISDRVVQMNAPNAPPISTVVIQRKCTACEEEEKHIQGKTNSRPPVTVGSSLVDQALQSGGEALDDSTRSFMEEQLNYDFSQVRIHNDSTAHQSSNDINARAYTHGQDIVFAAGQYRPNTSAGKQLLAHELVHVIQQNGSGIEIQRKEDWDFTPADYDALKKGKKDLTFGTDSAWVPQKLKDNILVTLKFVLTSTKPVRTAGINVKDFFHGHLVIPKRKVTKELATGVPGFEKASEDLEKKGKGGSEDVTTTNIGTFSKAMEEIEKLATPVVNEALKIKGAAVIYHTFEFSGPEGMKVGDPTRNIITDIGGSPKSYKPPDIDNASSYTNEYKHVLQFAFLVDENGVIHVTVGSTYNLSRVTGTPLE